MSQAISPPSQTIESSSAPLLYAQPICDPHTEHLRRLEKTPSLPYLRPLSVSEVLAAHDVQLRPSSEFRAEEQLYNSITRPSVWATSAFIVLLAIAAARKRHVARKPPDKSQRSASRPPPIRVGNRNPIGQAVQEEALATSPRSLTPSPSQHSTRFDPWHDQRALATGPHSPPRWCNHVSAPVVQTPRPSSQGATNYGTVDMKPRDATWSVPSPEGALRGWTFFLSQDGRLPGRVRKRSQDPRPISSGPYSDVWKCDIESNEPPNKYLGTVAVKILRQYVQGEGDQVNASQRMNARLNQEMITWAGARCSNTVPLIGVMSFPVHALIIPWFDNGSLSIYLGHYPAVNRLKLICDIAKGLEHLHSCTPIIVHADLKPENILINDRGDALITDFGTATFLGEDRSYTPSHLHGGTMLWMAPEIILGKPDMRSRTGDVYAFGSLTCYIITGLIPESSQLFSQLAEPVKGTNNSLEPIDKWHKHPEFQSHFGGLVAGIIRRCWSRVPEARPPMHAIVKELVDLREKRESLVPRRWS